MKLYFLIYVLNCIRVLLTVTSNCEPYSQYPIKKSGTIGPELIDNVDNTPDPDLIDNVDTTPDPDLIITVDTNNITKLPEYEEGYVFEEPIGVACIKWGFYIPQDKKESVEAFRNRSGVSSTGRNLREHCEKGEDCRYPLECFNKKCQCLHLWNTKRKVCQIPPKWAPKSGPGCFAHNQCVEKADCFIQYQCHCDGICQIVHGICLCEHPFPPLGFQQGHCERKSDDDYTRHIKEPEIV